CFHAPPTTETYPLSLHDALPISPATRAWRASATDGPPSSDPPFNAAGHRRALRLAVRGRLDPDRFLPKLPRRLVQHPGTGGHGRDRKSTRLNSSHVKISYAVFCL